LEQLPAAIQQALERIIGERQLANADKMLSLCDKDLAVLVQGKAGAEVEIGNKLWLEETGEGMIADYKLYKGVPADPSCV